MGGPNHPHEVVRMWITGRRVLKRGRYGTGRLIWGYLVPSGGACVIYRLFLRTLFEGLEG